MKYFVFICLTLSCFVSFTKSLTCYRGEEWIHEFAKSVGGDSVECTNTEHYCLRMESTGTQFAYPVNVTAMTCATQDVCENHSCGDLSTQILEMASRNDDSNDSNNNSENKEDMLFFKLKECQVACCQEDNCNFQSIASIRGSKSLLQNGLTEDTLRELNSAVKNNSKTTQETLLRKLSLLSEAKINIPTQAMKSLETATQGAGHISGANFVMLFALSFVLAVRLILS